MTRLHPGGQFHALFAAVALLLGQQVWATVRLPEDFNVEKDFDVKNKFQKAQKHIRCDLCKMTVGNTFDSVGLSFTEDDIYDHIEKICDAEELYNKHELIETPSEKVAWHLKAVTDSSSRSEHTVRWQSHAMKELCDNIIRPYDDEIKDEFLRSLKAREKAKAPPVEAQERLSLVDAACKKVKLCKADDSKSDL
eukprot:TRINITY_DN46286_c0_g1_i1.p1 TRINITY_DN46286_c0_g1~~TRINITY_DN46286_c0_g1_i1.p1  ORF type:complete len:194 (-),score=46.78 TRINITY_DN46286_c0_g1_i1:46-627(-)